MNEELGKTERRILCVQEGTHVADNLRALLPDVEFATVATASDALDEARDGLFDLYIISSRLKDMDSALLCRVIRQFDPHTPILLCVHAGAESGPGPVDGVVVQGSITNPIDAFAAPQTIRNSLMRARQESIEARVAECAAINDEVMERLRDASHQLTGAGRALSLAHNTLIMARAYDAFAAAGGMRADFNRMWPALYKEVHDKAR